MQSIKYAILLFFLCATGIFAQSHKLVITHVTVIDGTGAAPQKDCSVVINENKIEAIGKSEKIPEGADILDGSGKFLIPGLWDAHVHLTLTEGDWARKISIPLFVANGIVGIRDMGGNFDTINGIRKDIADGKMIGPHIVAAGPMLDGPGEPFPGIIRLDNVAAAKSAVDSLKEMHVDFVKILSSIPRDVYFAISQEAKKQNIHFLGHVPQSISASEASDAGQYSIEHLDGVLLACSGSEDQIRKDIDEALAKKNYAAFAEIRTRMIDTYSSSKADALFAKFVKNSTWQVPTFAFLQSDKFLDNPKLLDDPRLQYIPGALRKAWDPAEVLKGLSEKDIAVGKKRFQKSLELAGSMKKAGVGIVSGTDVDGQTGFVFPGFSLHDEIATMVQVGFTNMEALQSATSTTAKFLGLSESYGTVEKGKSANLLLLDADPLLDIHNTQKIAAVVLNGRVIKRTELDEMLAGVKNSAAQQ